MLVADPDFLIQEKTFFKLGLKSRITCLREKEENCLFSSKFKTKVQLSINLRRIIINLQNVSINFAMNF